MIWHFRINENLPKNYRWLYFHERNITFTMACMPQRVTTCVLRIKFASQSPELVEEWKKNDRRIRNIWEAKKWAIVNDDNHVFLTFPWASNQIYKACNHCCGHLVVALQQLVWQATRPPLTTSTVRICATKQTNKKLRSTSCVRWMVQIRRIPAWRSTSVGRWTMKPGWNHRSIRSTFSLVEQWSWSSWCLGPKLWFPSAFCRQYLRWSNKTIQYWEKLNIPMISNFLHYDQIALS